MSEQITRKRARVESEQHDESNGGQNSDLVREKDEELWYEDGNIILIAGDTEFRVFRGILSDPSPVFKDMFSLPQPSSSSSEPSCPVVHVTDSPQDLRHVLRLCMPRIDSSPFEPSHPSFDTISAVIRLGHKYQISSLVDHSVAYLKRYYLGRDGYDEWAKSGCARPPSFPAVHAIGVINFARLVEDDALLPGAYPACSELEEQIAHGFTREDGSRERLSPEDLGECFRAKRILVTACYVNARLVYEPTPSRYCP